MAFVRRMQGKKRLQGTLLRSGAVFVLLYGGFPLWGQVLPEAPPSPCPSVISGSIVDTAGSEIPFAQVRVLPIAENSGFGIHEGVAAADGTFRLEALPEKTCLLQIIAKGFVTRTISSPGPALEIELTPSDTADVTVTTNQEEIADAQIAVEEHQMIGGFVPNFYVTYDFHAVPLNKRQKFQLAYKTLINPYTNVINAGVAGLEQADNALPGYGQGVKGYAKRLGAQTADTAIGTVLAGAVLPIVFRQDPRYFYMGHGSLTHRALYALSTAVIARGDNGRWQPAYAALIGDFTAGAISNLYYPKSDRSGGTVTLYNGLISTGLDGLGNVIQEFVFKHFTPHAGKNP